jgi:hypothetical protein
MRMRTLISSALATAAVAVPVVAVTAPADAATLRTWNRLAQCEAGGNWHINTGNGYYGGLQISAATWRGHGGTRFARIPSRATKAEQIRVGERIRRTQGWRAWPACSARLGLR